MIIRMEELPCKDGKKKLRSGRESENTDYIEELWLWLVQSSMAIQASAHKHTRDVVARAKALLIRRESIQSIETLRKQRVTLTF